MRFRFLDLVGLSRPLETTDGTIPEGTAGTVLDAYPKTGTYMVEFGGPWLVPETVPADALYQRIGDMSDTALDRMMEAVNHEAATGGLIDATGWTREQLRAFLESRVRPSVLSPTQEETLRMINDPPAAEIVITADTPKEAIRAWLRSGDTTPAVTPE